MRSTGTGPALRWAAGAGSILGIGVGSPAGRNGGADGAAVGLALCASPRTCAPPSPGSWQPPAMWSPRSSSTGSADTSTSRSSTSERRPGGGVGGCHGGGSEPESPFPVYSGRGQDICPGLPGGPGRGGARVRGCQGTVSPAVSSPRCRGTTIAGWPRWSRPCVPSMASATR